MQTVQKTRGLLCASMAALIAIGIVMIYSASAIYAYDQMKDSAYFLKRHLIYLAAGYLIFWRLSKVNLQGLRRYAKWALAAALFLLVLVLIPHVGHSSGGARRWFKFFGFSFQPSEFLKIVLIFYMADFLDRKKESLDNLRYVLFPALFVLGLSAGLVFLQPDLGTAVAIALVVLILFFAAGLRLRYLTAMILTALPGLFYAMLSKPYRRKRILAFFNPWDDPRGVGFQIIQSFLALGSGGLFGVGLGKSQQKLFYLPESHTDFIFSIIGEELGFLGASAVILLFIVFLFSGMRLVYKSRSFFTQLLGVGLVSLIGLEAVINIGVTIGALPTKGLSLPFISYGGSALLANMAAAGILLNLSKEITGEEAGS
jgi:cell division protein FtsW